MGAIFEVPYAKWVIFESPTFGSFASIFKNVFIFISKNLQMSFCIQSWDSAPRFFLIPIWSHAEWSPSKQNLPGHCPRIKIKNIFVNLAATGFEPVTFRVRTWNAVQWPIFSETSPQIVYLPAIRVRFPACAKFEGLQFWYCLNYRHVLYLFRNLQSISFCILHLDLVAL